jgi:hypothetical protein
LVGLFREQAGFELGLSSAGVQQKITTSGVAGRVHSACSAARTQHGSLVLPVVVRQPPMARVIC